MTVSAYKNPDNSLCTGVTVSILAANLSNFALDLMKALTAAMMEPAQEGGGEHAEKHSRL